MRKLFTLFILLITVIQASAQQKNLLQRITQKILSDKPDTSRAPGLMPLPVFGFAQETGLELGVGVIKSFYIDRKDTLNRASTLYGFGSYSTKGQINLVAKVDIWEKENKMHFNGQNSFNKIHINFYGVGNSTKAADKDLIIQTRFRSAWDIERLLAKSYYGGINLGFEYYTFKDKDEGGVFDTDKTLIGTSGGKVLYFGIIQAFDNRNTNTYTTNGSYAKATYSYAPNFFGGNNFHGSIIKVDLRTFVPVSNRITAGFNAVYNGIDGSNTPLYLLPQLGNDAIMRGYYMGRFRDKNLLAAQMELRYRFHQRFAVVAFGGAGKVFNSSLELNNLKPNLGAGVRYFFDPAKGLSLRLDYGVGEQRPGEKRQSGLYVGFGEAF